MVPPLCSSTRLLRRALSYDWHVRLVGNDLNLTRMTCEYQADEDRIRICGLALSDTGDDETHEMWLTQRLALRLIPALVDVIEKSEQRHVSGVSMAQQANLHGLKQELVANHAAASPEPAVHLKAQSPRWLISHIDLSRQDGKLVLVLRNARYRLQFDLNAVALRQWLNILLHSFRQGQWPLHGWPEWLLQKEQLAARQSVTH